MPLYALGVLPHSSARLFTVVFVVPLQWVFFSVFCLMLFSPKVSKALTLSAGENPVANMIVSTGCSAPSLVFMPRSVIQSIPSVTKVTLLRLKL